MTRLNNNSGMALIMTLMIVVVLIGFSSVFVLRTINEWNTADRERRAAQSFYIAEGGGEDALDIIDDLINTQMLNTISNTSPSVVINLAQSSVASGDGLGFLMQTVKNSFGTPLLTLDGTGTEASYHIGPLAMGSGNYEYDIIITKEQNPSLAGLDQWDFPFYYKIKSSGVSNGTTRKVILFGDFTVRVQRANFAKYALFTNQQSMPSGTRVWFTDKTNFAGPIHTNDRFNIALNPSGTFEGMATQVQQSARFYNSGSPILADADHNGTEDVPTFNAGFTRGVSSIALSSSVQKQDMIDQATNGTAYGSNGIYVPNNGTDLTGGVYVKGNASITMSVNGSDQAVYTINQGSTTKIVTVDVDNLQTSVQTVGLGTTVYNGLPDGVDDVGTIIFVDGTVTSLGGTVQRDTQVTISSEADVSITNNIVYSDYTPAVGAPGDAGYVPPNANGANNLLGIVTWNGDVRVGTSAPDDLNIHGTILAQNGIVQVDSYNDQGVGPRGTATLLGGVISDYYGAFGLFNGSTGALLSGYGRNFVYDNRMLIGTAPPYFPSLNTFIAFTNNIMDKITLQEGGF